MTGYADLGLPTTLPPPETLAYRDGIFLGQRVRIGLMVKPIYVTNHTAWFRWQRPPMAATSWCGRC